MSWFLLLSTSMHINSDLHGFLALLEEGFVLHPLALQFLVGVRAARLHGPRVIIIVVLAMIPDCAIFVDLHAPAHVPVCPYPPLTRRL